MYPPFGIMYVADALEQVGFKVKLFHETENGLEKIIQAVRDEPPLYVGFSTITGPQLIPTIEASRQVKALSVPVVWGGVHATIMPLAVLREEYVDFVIVNEGELTAQQIALTLAGELTTTRDQIAGLAYKNADGQAVFHQERSLIPDLDQF